MILIDLGNTNAKIYTNSKMKKIATSEILKYLNSIDEEVLLCSVVPEYSKQIIEKYPNVELITSSDYHKMFDNDGKLDSKGADRIIAAYGAVKLISSKVVVVDIGTCVTVDVVDNRSYLSGFIYPGFLMIENLLDEKISQLPKPEYSETAINTTNQIYWANLYGFIGSLDKLIEVSIVDNDYQVVLTGGSVLKLKEEYNIDILVHLSKYNPVYIDDLIKKGLEIYVKENQSN